MKKDILNLGALTCIQGANALAPLVVFPFALHALGSSAYAELVTSEALSVLVLALVVFSFDVIGVSRTVHLKAEDDQASLSELFSSIVYIRLLLFASAALFSILFYRFVMGGSWITMALWTMVPLAYVFQSTWLFQGLERNAAPAVFALISRLACVGLIFALVGHPSDKYLIPAIMGSTYLAGGLACFGYAIWRFRLRLKPVAWDRLTHMAADGKHIFYGNIAVSLSRDVNVLILGLVGVPAHSLAAYSVAEKLTKSLQAVARPLNQLFFTKTVRAIRDETTPDRSIAVRIFRQTLPQLGAVICVLMTLVVAYLVIGRHMSVVADYPNINEIISYLSFMAWGVFCGIVSFMFGSVGLNYLNERAYYFGVILFVGALSATSCFVLAQWIGGAAAVYCYLGSEILTALLIVQKFLFKIRFLDFLGGRSGR